MNRHIINYAPLTPRRFHRSLAEAFPDIRARCLSGPHKRPLTERVYGVVLAVALGSIGATLLVHELSK